MTTVYSSNFPLQSANHAFSAAWKWSRVMKAAGWTYKASSDGTTKDTTGTAANDKWGGNADPTLDTYPTALDTVAAWWNAQGTTTLKLSMTTASTGTFVRGEKVTQATSGAEGELVGLDFSSTLAQGHAVIIPRTGTFNNSNVITGAVSGATFTPTALETYVMEIVLYKTTNTTSGSIYIQRVSNENENASRFSVLTGAAGCTATIAPGAGGTGNAFPAAGSYVGLGSQTGAPAHSLWFQTSTTLGRAQIVAVNNVGATGVTPDCTTWICIGDTSVSTQAQCIAYMRCDDTEDADLDPFVWVKPTSVGNNSANVRLDATGAANSFTQGTAGSGGLGAGGTAASNFYRGWRRRGFTTGDAFEALQLGCPAISLFSSLLCVITDNENNPETIACAYDTKRLREKMWMIHTDNLKKHRKGTLRWAWVVQGLNTFDTLDNKTKLVVASYGTTLGAIVFGPYDGTTTPMQAG